MRSKDRDTLQDIERLSESVRKLRRALHETEKAIVEIEKLGATRASKYVDGRGCLYLIHPQVNGVRVREYIGRDAVVQKAAMARVERWNELETLRTRKAQIEGVLGRIDNAVHEGLQSAERV